VQRQTVAAATGNGPVPDNRPGPRPRPGFHSSFRITLGLMVGTTAIMVVTRDQLRPLYLGSAVDLGRFGIHAQWGNFWLLAILLVLVLVTVFLMVRMVLNEKAEGPDAA